MIKNTNHDALMMKIIVATTYITMIMINALANILPINGIGTGAVSDAYPNLFAPAGYTFLIWSVIYLALGGHVIFQFKKTFYSPETASMVQKMRKWFSLSSVANSLWILSWHYDLILISMILMLVILFSLVRCMFLIHTAKLTSLERRWGQIPFSIYFGWITVATIANFTTLLVKINWNAFGLRMDAWTSAIVIIGLGISILAIVRFKDVVYGTVILWAYGGILSKHLSSNGFDGQYPVVINTVVIAMLILVGTLIYISYERIKRIRIKFRS